MSSVFLLQTIIHRLLNYSPYCIHVERHLYHISYMQHPYGSKSSFTGSPVRKIVLWVDRGRYEYHESKSRKKIFRPKKNFLTEKNFSIEIFFSTFFEHLLAQFYIHCTYCTLKINKQIKKINLARFFVGRAQYKMACLASISRISVDSKCISELANTFLSRQKKEMDARQAPAGQSQPNSQR